MVALLNGNGKADTHFPRFSLKPAIKHLEVQTNNLLEHLTSRADAIAKNSMDHPDRNLNADCGYPEDDELGVENFKEFFKREGIARKVVTTYPDETFQILPDVFESPNYRVETRFENKWKRLEDDLSLWHYIHRIDIVSGIGRYGAMFMGFDDSTDPEKPLAGIGRDGFPRPDKKKRGTELRYLRCFDESEAIIDEREKKIGPRYGYPKYYKLRVADPDESGFGSSSKDMRVHWSRILHVADNRLSSEIFGIERMRPVFNRVFDLRKIMGGSAEMFWRGAFPGMSFEALPEFVASGQRIDKAAIKKEFEDYSNKLKRYLALVGFVAKPLLPQMADPSKHVDEQLRNIAASLDVPFRVFTGSEIAHLASTQDITSWNKRLARRQRTYINPMIIRPFIHRCIMAGALPPVRRLYIDWTDLNAMSDEQKADVALKKTQAMAQYTTSGIENWCPPMEYYTMILGMSVEQANHIMKMVSKKAKKLTTDVWKKPEPNATNTSRSKLKDPTAKTGRSRNALGSR